MKRIIVIIAAVIMAVSSAGEAQSPCLQFEPAVESIVGNLIRKTFPGPPNYESIKEGDTPETAWFVRLDDTLCMIGKPNDELNSENINNIKFVQLVFLGNEYKTKKYLIGKKVKSTGTMFTAHTGHHHAKILMKVHKLVEIK